jgi:predicted secreted protein
MTAMDVTIENETLDITSFGDEWSKFCRGMQSWTATINGHLDLDDASQATLVDAAEGGTLINNLRFYIDSTTYFASDLVADPEAGLYIDSYNFTADNNSIVSFTMSVTGNGPIKRYP